MAPAVFYVQALLDSASVVLITLLARRLFDTASAALAGGLAAGYALFLYYDALLLKVSLSLFLITLALWLVLHADAGNRAARWLAAGAALGVAALTRGNILALVPPIAGWILLARPGRALPALRAAGALALGLGLAILPVTARNYAVAGDWVLTTSGAGIIFSIGNFRGNDSGRN